MPKKPSVRQTLVKYLGAKQADALLKRLDKMAQRTAGQIEKYFEKETGRMVRELSGSIQVDSKVLIAVQPCIAVQSRKLSDVQSMRRIAVAPGRRRSKRS